MRSKILAILVIVFHVSITSLMPTQDAQIHLDAIMLPLQEVITVIAAAATVVEAILVYSWDSQ